MQYNSQVVEKIYNQVCFRNDGCLEGLQVREFARRLWSHWEAQMQQQLKENGNEAANGS